MNHHQRRGFQTNIKNDIYHIEERLQDYDPALYIMYNPSTNEHLIMDGITELAIMKIPQIGFEYLDARVVDQIKKSHAVSGFNASHEMQEYEDRVEREKEKKLEDMAYWMAKDLKRPLIEAHDYNKW